MTEYTKTVTVTVDCPDCQSRDVKKAGLRNGYQRYQCNDCKKKFRDDGQAEGRKYDAEVIGAAIRAYCAGLSYKQIAELLEDFLDIPEPSKDTIFEWVRGYSQVAKAGMRDYPATTSGHWLADELEIRIRGEKVWVWNVMDEGTRYILATHLFRSHSKEQAKRVLTKARMASDRAPDTITTDKWTAYPPAIRDVFPKTIHIQAEKLNSRLNNNICERQQGIYRDRLRVVRGLESIETGQQFLDGWCVYYNLFRDHSGIGGRKPAELARVKAPYKEWADVVRSTGEVPPGQPRRQEKQEGQQRRRRKSERRPRAFTPESLQEYGKQLPMDIKIPRAVKKSTPKQLQPQLAAKKAWNRRKPRLRK